MRQITDSQLRQIFADHSDCFADGEGQHFPIAAMTVDKFIECFREAQELLSVQGTKPLSEITDEDKENIALMFLEITAAPSESLLYCFHNSIKPLMSNFDRMQYRIVDYLRSKGYILPTQKT